MVDSLLDGETHTEEYTARLLLETSQQPSILQQKLEDELRSVSAPLPLGKALHLLLHVKVKVLSSAIDQVWRKKDSLDQKRSPIVNALSSLDFYVTEHDSYIRHIYDLLKSKILKSKSDDASNSLRILAGLMLWSPHQDKYQDWMKQQLSSMDKKSALSVVMVLSFITKEWAPLDDSTNNECVEQIVTLSTFIPFLTSLLERFGELPTLLACTTYDTLLTTSVYMTTVYLSPTNSMTSAFDHAASTPKIAFIQTDVIEESRLASIRDLWTELRPVLTTVQKWQNRTDPVTLAAWNELLAFMCQCQTVLSGTNMDGYQQVSEGWYWLSTILASSQILSKKSIKKSKKVWKLKSKSMNGNLSDYLKILMLALTQNGYWIHSWNTEQAATSLSGYDENDREQAKTICRSMVTKYPLSPPWSDVGHALLPMILGLIPHLYAPCLVSSALFPSLFDFSCDDSDADDTYLTNITDIFLSQSDDAIAILVSRIQPDDTLAKESQQQASTTRCFHLLRRMLDKSISSLRSQVMESSSVTTHVPNICEGMARALLSRVCYSNKSCELLIQCMPFIHLSVLLLSLMKMLGTATDERSNHITKGLIAKALLIDTWSGDSILVYIDLVRDLLQKRQYRDQFESMAIDKKATPNNISHIFDQENKDQGSFLDDEELARMETELLWPLQLWSTKVDSSVIGRIIPLLIDKYHDAPEETVFIRIWQMLAFSIVQSRSLAMTILTKCSDIMEGQRRLFDMVRQGLIRKEAIDIYALLLPILILNIFPKQMFGQVSLPSSKIQQWQKRWPSKHNSGIELKRAAVTLEEDEVSLYSKLADDLLLRYEYSGLVTGMEQIHQLTIDTLYKLFVVE